MRILWSHEHEDFSWCSGVVQEPFPVGIVTGGVHDPSSLSRLRTSPSLLKMTGYVCTFKRAGARYIHRCGALGFFFAYAGSAEGWMVFL